MDAIMLRGKKDWNGFKIKKSLLQQGFQGGPSPAQGEL
jgi:hypothetical protein